MPAGSCRYEERPVVTEQSSKRPFHETVVDAIRLASDKQLELLATLIKRTKIPKNYDAIIAAWRWRLRERIKAIENAGETVSIQDVDSGVLSDLEYQRALAAAEQSLQELTKAVKSR